MVAEYDDALEAVCSIAAGILEDPVLHFVTCALVHGSCDVALGERGGLVAGVEIEVPDPEAG